MRSKLSNNKVGQKARLLYNSFVDKRELKRLAKQEKQNLIKAIDEKKRKSYGLL